MDASDPDRGIDPPPPPRRPGWLFVLGVVAAAAFLALIIFLHLTGAIGPGTH